MNTLLVVFAIANAQIINGDAYMAGKAVYSQAHESTEQCMAAKNDVHDNVRESQGGEYEYVSLCLTSEKEGASI